MKTRVLFALLISLTSCVLPTQPVPGPKGDPGDPGKTGMTGTDPWSACGEDGAVCYDGDSVAIGTAQPIFKREFPGVGTILAIEGKESAQHPQQADGRLELVNARTNPVVGDALGEILFVSKNSGDVEKRGALIYSVSEGEKNANGGFGGKLIFATKRSDPAQVIESMVISSQGNVGIGTVAPASRLHIEDADPTLTIRGNIASAGNGAVHRDAISFQNSIGAELASINAVYLNATSQLQLDVSDGGSIQFSTRPLGEDTPVERMSIAPDGNVGIGTPPPSNARLTVYADSNAQQLLIGRNTGGLNAYLGVDANNVFRILDGNTNGVFAINLLNGLVDIPGNITTKSAIVATGDITSGGMIKTTGGGVCCPSDLRLKQKVEPLAGALSRLLGLRGVTFEWKEPEKHANRRGTQIGMIAQEVEQVFPDWVDTDPQGFKTLSYRGFEALAVESLRELKVENDHLESRNAELTETVNHMNAQLTSLTDVQGQLKAEREARLSLEARLLALEVKMASPAVIPGKR